MKTLQILLLALVNGSILASTVPVYETIAPRTKLEAFETQTGVVIIKGTGQVGALATSTANVSVKCRESISLKSGHREHGVLIGFKEGNAAEENSFLDYDELDPLLVGMDYISRADYNITELPSFAVGYITRDELRISAYSSNKNPGTIQATLQTRRDERVRVLLAPEQLAQLRTLIQQAKTKLDELRAARAK